MYSDDSFKNVVGGFVFYVKELSIGFWQLFNYWKGYDLFCSVGEFDSADLFVLGGGGSEDGFYVIFYVLCGVD